MTDLFSQYQTAGKDVNESTEPPAAVEPATNQSETKEEEGTGEAKPDDNLVEPQATGTVELPTVQQETVPPATATVTVQPATVEPEVLEVEPPATGTVELPMAQEEPVDPPPTDTVEPAMVQPEVLEDDAVESTIAPDEIGDVFESFANETLPPRTFSNGTFAPDYFDNFTLPPKLVDEDLPWFLKDGTVAPEFVDGGTLPPWLLNGTFAPGLVQDGEISGDFIVDDWMKDLLPGIKDFSFETTAEAIPFFRESPFVEYQTTQATLEMTRMPRFGRTHDFASIAFLVNDEGSSKGEEYLTGLAFMSGMLLGFFIIWGVALAISKCCRSCALRREASAGHPEPKSLDEESEVADEIKNQVKRRVLCTRIVFFLAGIIQILFAIFFIMKGLPNFHETTGVVEGTLESGRELLGDAYGISVPLRSIRDFSAVLHDQIEAQFNPSNPCPGFPQFEDKEVGADVSRAVNSTLQQLATLVGELDQSIEMMDSGLLSGEERMDAADDAVKTAREYEMIGNLILLPLLILTSLMLVGTVAAHNEMIPNWFLCGLNWIVLPIFILFTICTCLLGTISLVSAAMNADFCVDPDITILDLMNNSGSIKPDDSMFSSAEYYIFQCTDRSSKDALYLLRQQDTDLGLGIEAVGNFSSGITEISTRKLAFGCQKDFGPLFDSLNEMITLLEMGKDLMASIFSLMDCERIAFIYTDLVYDGMCTHAVSGFTWCTFCLFIISFMGMIMITLRSSYNDESRERGSNGPPSKLCVGAGETMYEEDGFQSSSASAKDSSEEEEEEVSHQNNSLDSLEGDEESCKAEEQQGSQVSQLRGMILKQKQLMEMETNSC